MAGAAVGLLVAGLLFVNRRRAPTGAVQAWSVFGADEARIAETFEAHKEEAPTEQLLALLEARGRRRREARAALERTVEAWESGVGVVGLGARNFFPPGGVAISALTGPCASAFCAGVATRSLALASLSDPIEDLPSNAFLELLTGPSSPPLAGWGGARVRTRWLGTLIRLAARGQYHSHLFEDQQGAAPGPVNTVKVLVLRDAAGAELTWVKTDLVGAFQDLRAAVLLRLHNQGVTGPDDGNFLFHGTHTHSGHGALNPRWFPMVATLDLFDADLFDSIANEIVEAVVEARENLTPARLGTGEVEIDSLTANRRHHCAGDPLDSDPDPTVGITRIDLPDDTPLATVFNFAIHGTSLDASNLLLSPDNMGYAEAWVEAHDGGTALFINGTEGDVRPVAGAPDAVGEPLGQKVIGARSAIQTSSQVTLRSTYCQLDEPPIDSPSPCSVRLEPLQFRPLMYVENPLQPGCYLDRGNSPIVVTIPKAKDPPIVEREGVVLAAHRLEYVVGGATRKTLILTLPGEPITDLGSDLRGRVSGVDDVWIFGLVNAHMGYIVTKAEYLQGGYESGANLFGPTEGERLVDIAAALAAALP